MLVEAPVLGREHRLDQVVGELLERDGVVVPDAARADLVAVAVEEGDGELGLLQPVVVGGFAEGRDRERQHQTQPADAERRAFRERLDQHPAPPAGDVEAVHEGGEALVVLAQPARRRGRRPNRAASRSSSSAALELRLQVLAERVAQAVSPDSGPRAATVRRSQGRNGAGPPSGRPCRFVQVLARPRESRQWRKRNRVKGIAARRSRSCGALRWSRRAESAYAKRDVGAAVLEDQVPRRDDATASGRACATAAAAAAWSSSRTRTPREIYFTDVGCRLLDGADLPLPRL